MKTNLMIAVVTLSSVSLIGALGCAASVPCRKGPKDDVAVGARTAGEAVKTGAETGVEGVKTGGKTVKGLVEGGTSGAKDEWDKGKQQTKATAREGAADTRDEADVPPCK